MGFRKLIKSYQDFPKKGVIFWDFSELLLNSQAFIKSIDVLCDQFANHRITKIAAIESKGFTIGAAMAYKLQKPLVLIRKPGLIPGKTNKQSFIKEYGFGEYQIKQRSFSRNDQVLVVYDIMAGAGATKAAIQLVEKQHAKVIGCCYMIELEYLNGRQDLKEYNIFSLVKIPKLKNLARYYPEK